MHGVSPQQFAESVSAFLVPYYLALAVMNGIAAYYLWQKHEPVTYYRRRLPGFTFSFTNALLWTIVAIVYVVLAAFAAASKTSLHLMPQMPNAFRDLVNESTGPVVYSRRDDCELLAVLYWPAFVVCEAGRCLVNLELDAAVPRPVDAGPSYFNQIVAKPDNVPIVALVFLLAFFTWLAAYRAVENDRRKEQGPPPVGRSWTTKKSSCGRISFTQR